ncbi:hypothetical protein [Polaribacter sp. SA4-12]|uniref:hypothetical protein n=1 Tax=Polaribacter sp. SA4-12 TaxID=1312072 RepID=UPI0018DF7709|nr:hypothetical protein [Polaribacter sp. SA4-12]
MLPQILIINLENIKIKPKYLALTTDAYSKKIVGYNVSDSLNVKGSLIALEMALKNRVY